jgi:hypothetical protein
VLKARKGPETLAPLLISCCPPGQLPNTMARLLLDIHACLSGAPAAGQAPAAGGNATP